VSQEDLEIVRGHIQAWHEEDAPRALSFLDPHAVLDVSRTDAFDSAFYGHEAIGEFFRRFAGTFEEFQWQVERLTDLGSGTVLAVLMEIGRGKGSGVPVNRPLACLYTVIEGKITLIATFRSERDALKALGLGGQAMSTNLDLVRLIYADWERGDFSRADWAHPEFEYVVVGGPEPVSGIGLAGMAEAMRGVLSAWEDHCIEAVECRELDEERVLVFTRARGRGKASGLDLAQMRAEWIDVLHIRDGKVTRLVTYADRDRGLADLSLEEDAMPEESTTPDLEETLRRLREALKSGDLDAAVAVYAPDAVWDVSLLGLEGVFEGREAIRGAYENLIAPYEDLEVVAEEFRDLGNGVTLVVLLVRGRLRGSTRFVESRLAASVAMWANGLIERQTAYLDIDEARAAAERLAQERE
jgi:ketosteroid isomerase-like protein